MNVPRFAVWCYVSPSSQLGPIRGGKGASKEMTMASYLGADHAAAAQCSRRRFISSLRFHPCDPPNSMSFLNSQCGSKRLLLPEMS